MTLHGRLVLACIVVGVVPVVAFAYGVRRVVTQRIAEQHQARLDGAVLNADAALQQTHRELGVRLSAVIEEMRDDNALRILLTTDASDRSYLLDYAERQVRVSGLAALRVYDGAARIVSSGHFRAEFDRFDDGSLDVLRRSHGPVLLRLLGPEGGALVQARADSFTLGSAQYMVLAGTPPNLPEGPVSGGDIRATLAFSDSPPSVDGEVAALEVPFFDELQSSGGGFAHYTLQHDDANLAAVTAVIDRLVWRGAGVAAMLAVFISIWLAGIISRPLTRLAEQTAQVDWNKLDVAFDDRRSDEVGTLAKVLSSMTGRLRANRHRLQEVERRATMGELARQVNHDIKNGIVPIRNVVSHLSEVAAQDPAQLAALYKQRAPTLDASLEYLETLSGNYARLSPEVAATRLDVNPVLDDVVSRVSARSEVTVRTALARGPLWIHADPTILGRVVANLVSNAMDAIDGTGTVLVSSRREDAHVVVSVDDNGRGMTEEEFARAFDDFYTSKPGGTGLGLSIVRRLVVDMNGTVRVESEPGTGTRAILQFPAVDA